MKKIMIMFMLSLSIETVYASETESLDGFIAMLPQASESGAPRPSQASASSPLASAAAAQHNEGEEAAPMDLIRQLIGKMDQVASAQLDIARTQHEISGRLEALISKENSKHGDDESEDGKEEKLAEASSHGWVKDNLVRAVSFAAGYFGAECAGPKTRIALIGTTNFFALLHATGHADRFDDIQPAPKVLQGLALGADFSLLHRKFPNVNVLGMIGALTPVNPTK